MGSKKKEEKEKTLEKMTAKELREAAMGIEGVTGASGMNKEELIDVIRKARGIEAPARKRAEGGLRAIKQKMREIKAKQASAIEASDEKMAAIYRKRAIRLKKKTRRAA